ncbi:cysteine--1-D-myo-inosityl 2-amino-2-deoxy-alpha-D-glucopyranoside ligase [Brachybacterium sp. EF45031]|uniref:cysteine--1-D-myo-inosityl 2-amino-2-deoxy-alpha-D-glucopyranoside ligase n=1 Tax=Brachybacterium sillae TaxID=2810536 RepID=UPI00217E2364|nr:cysteine--1-D-myo-inosityl 2-amino-2-deoxy-alpha-D-glucopyranoside ligase [Brachybacterium sillae]MCS6710683.1 cysteine--1-D-myo-inosityl 2-amino-2-deoxy-alpha-D-glucopyranoside ligase [Brachybacterium sillae]
MRSWNPPRPAALAPSGVLPSLHDSRTGRIRPVTLAQPGRARIYVCGITPYDSTHLGHAATYHAADLMRRILLDAGVEVEVAQNITDVDDPLLERAERDGVGWQDLAADQAALFASDMEALRVIPPQTYRSVSEAMDGIIDFIERLRAAGRTYQVPTPDAPGDGQDWYLDLSQDGALGAVCGWTEDEMMDVFAERGGDPERPGKRGRFDPLLWRAAREGEPSWPGGSLGPGRPGWHVECLHVAEDALGLPVDIQTGGRDLVFPHHDLGNAHAVALGTAQASHYPHVGLVAYEGTKMSKSLGNLVFVSRLLQGGAEPAAIRLALLAHHYRSDWEWTDAELERGTERLAAYRAAAGRRDAAVVEQLRSALRDDLDTPRALEILDGWAAASDADASVDPAHDGDRPDDVALALDALLGIDLGVGSR